MSEFIMPPGYRFEPTDEELIRFYLSEKALGQPLPRSSIVEKELYGDNANQWDVFSDIDPWKMETKFDKNETKSIKKTIFVLTKLSKISPKRISRKAGCGLWDGQTGAITINNSQGIIICSKKMLTFRTKGDSNVTKIHGHWIMHEYSLDGVSLINGLKFINDYVICKITRSWKGKDLQVLENRKRSRTISYDHPNRDGNKKARIMPVQESISHNGGQDFDLLDQIDDLSPSMIEDCMKWLSDELNQPPTLHNGCLVQQNEVTYRQGFPSEEPSPDFYSSSCFDPFSMFN
ncbi:NAC domain-containing protein [Forsythia ovata]|uniref:NAC domain-containing protein n=1 Tax=Forsythia ovata TaxID=205694 RepID=A0ABD1WVV5_9LAMI